MCIRDRLVGSAEQAPDLGQAQTAQDAADNDHEQSAEPVSYTHLDEVSRQALRILRLFGDTETHRVIAQVGAEQEYFLVDKALFNQRKDLRMTGRTLFGAKPPRSQELDDHYFGAIKPRVAAYMKRCV